MKMNIDYSKLDPESSDFYKHFIKVLASDIRNIQLRYKDKDQRAEKYVAFFLVPNHQSPELDEPVLLFDFSVNVTKEIPNYKRTANRNYRIKYHSTKVGQLIGGHFSSVISNFDGCYNSYTLESFYNKKFDSINKAIVKSEDLLDQILFVYMIKKAQKGDSKSFDKLFSFFEEKAITIALNFIHTKAREMHLKLDSDDNLGDENIKQVARMILTLLLRGDQLSYFKELLKYKRRDTSTIGFLLTRRFKDIIVDYVETNLFKQLDGLYFCAKMIEKDYRKNKDDLLYRQMKTALAVRSAVVLDPFQWLKTDRRFNKDLYRPNKKAPLSIWLFGKKSAKGSESGRFWMVLNDWYKSSAITSIKIIDGKRKRWIRPEFFIGGIKSIDDARYLYPEIENEESETDFISPNFEKTKTEIELYQKDKKISDRDIKIIFLLALKKAKMPYASPIRQNRIAQSYKLSVRQVRRIWSKYLNWRLF